MLVAPVPSEMPSLLANFPGPLPWGLVWVPTTVYIVACDLQY